MEKHILVPSPPPPGERGGGLSEAGCSAAAVNLPKRLSRYFSKKGMKTQLKKCKSAIYSAILKHGISNFKLEILKYCSRAQCIKWEQYYIDLLKPEYNILKTAGSPLGLKHSDETRAKLSALNKGKNNPMFGKKHSEEYKAKMSEALKGENHPMFGKTGEKHHSSTLQLQKLKLQI